MLLRPTWLHIPGCLALVVWSQFFCVFLPPLLNIICFFWGNVISVLYWAHLCVKCSLGISNSFEEISSIFFPFCCFPLFLCIDCWGSLSYLFLLFLGTLHSDAYIFRFLLCFTLLFFSQVSVRPPQTAILLFCISFPWGWSWSLSPVPCHEPPSTVHQALYLSDLVP